MNKPPSRSAVKKAGSGVRKYARGEISEEKFLEYLAIIDRYRASFHEPVRHFRTHLVNLLEVAKIKAETTSRLKRLPTIVDKLSREPTLNLSLMHDIGGCRSVVPDLEALYRTRDLVKQYWRCEEFDYVSNPRESGYRAIHLVAQTEEQKPIELQIRTPVMHNWAQTVEAFSNELGENYKQDGDHLVQQFAFLLSKQSERIEMGIGEDQEINDRVNQLVPEIVKLLNKKRRNN